VSSRGTRQVQLDSSCTILVIQALSTIKQWCIFQFCFLALSLYNPSCMCRIYAPADFGCLRERCPVGLAYLFAGQLVKFRPGSHLHCRCAERPKLLCVKFVLGAYDDDGNFTQNKFLKQLQYFNSQLFTKRCNNTTEYLRYSSTTQALSQ